MKEAAPKKSYYQLVYKELGGRTQYILVKAHTEFEAKQIGFAHARENAYKPCISWNIKQVYL